MIAVGSDAPDFKLESQFDTEYSLSQFKGDKKFRLGTKGYVVKRSKGKGASGFIAQKVA